MGLVGGLGGRLEAQAPTLECDLRNGSVATAAAVRAAAGGYELLIEGAWERVAARELLAVRGRAAHTPDLLRIELVGGDVVFGAIAGGDANGAGCELESPVCGRLVVPVDHLAAIWQAGVDARDCVLPNGVEEALFVSRSAGFDILAGTLHRFGPSGVRFQLEGGDQPRWYGPREFVALRLAEGIAPANAPCRLVTRSDDRLAVAVTSTSDRGFECRFDGHTLNLPFGDVASLSWNDGVVHLSDLTPVEVAETGCDGPVLLPWRRDRSATGGPLNALGRTHGRGLGVHSRSRLSFVAPPGASHFWTRVAIDDSALALPVAASASVCVRIGDREVLRVDELQPGKPAADTGLVEVRAGDRVTLEVDFGAGRELGDRVDWLSPMFLLSRRP